MTFSVVAHCPDTGQFGIAISSSSIAVGARCPWLRPGIGAVSSQNITLPALGPLTLDLLEQGLTPDEAIIAALGQYGYSQYRQLIAIDHTGKTAHFSGANTLGIHKALSGECCVAAGNMLSNTGVVPAMVHTFETTPGDLADRLMAALQAGLAEGGEAGPVHSAALRVVGDFTWPIVDLRVDWADTDPLAALDRLWQAYRGQMQDYIDRAIYPATAPGYAVPGDER